MSLSTPATPPVATPPDEASRWSQVALWGAVVVPILAWTVHMVALASLVRYTCEHPGARWIMHGLTFSLGFVCVVCIAVAYRFARQPNGEEAVSVKANLRFLSHLAIIVGVANLLLIGAEGVYVLLFNSCAGS
jgi:hypothetical protein